MKRRRGLLAGLLLTAAAVGATTAHSHSILEDASSARPDPLLAPRCALSTTLSLHAIPRIVERDTCWACYWHRLFTAHSPAALPEPVWHGRTLASLPHRAAANVACFTRLSRGPPALL